MKVLKHVPPALRWRIWVVYRGNLSTDAYYTTRGLFEAPDYQVHTKPLLDEGDGISSEEDPQNEALEKNLGRRRCRKLVR
jgi:hypothetical protein